MYFNGKIGSYLQTLSTIRTKLTYVFKSRKQIKQKSFATTDTHYGLETSTLMDMAVEEFDKESVATLLYSTFSGTFSTHFSLEMEDNVISIFEKQTGTTVRRRSLVIDDEIPYLAFSPDGFVSNNTIMEIRTSDKSKELPPLDAILQEKKKISVYTGTIKLN
ncbi:hypothetical protein RN001_005266 [Aquatica leii]|uniref:Uncharacterized protein n=1 Tax=Aquatica leii TaxID=1421715 RepID=A0AAN7Q0Z3_9COLE|nr:hypothetical protein RN001_005266 [Aquatica leii]